jgi:hypothetical protein
MFEVVWTSSKGRPRKKELRALAALVELHRPAILEEWHLKVNVKAPGPEE